MRGTKGITLISLIITIIVMLILIAVTVNVLIESGIIGSAKNAANKTQTAYQNEATLDKITIGGVEYDSIQDFEQKRCSHTYGEWVVVKEATYTEAGERYRTCTKCNVKQTEYPDMLACETHAYGEWVVDTEPTCTTVGKQHQTCSVCGTVLNEDLEAYGHNYSAATCTTLATCSRCNSTTGELAPHNYVSGACSVCGVVPVTASTIANVTTKSDYYGKYVTGITLNNGDKSTRWRIFYVDTNNIYLIAEDYINARSYVSSDLVNYGDTNYKAYFSKTRSLSEYDGGAAEEAIFGEGTVGGALLKTYLDYLNSDSSLAKNNDNMRATAFMLDTTAWAGYTDSNQSTKYVDYAIGGPTIEMLKDSYNGYKGEIRYYTPLNSNGYDFSDSTEFSSVVGTLDTSISLYRYTLSKTKASGYWLASPSDNDEDNVCNVDYRGYVSGSFCILSNYGFRPVICLNTNAKLIPSGTDTYTVGY